MELRDEQIKLEDRLSFLDDVLAVGEMQLDAVRGKCSLELCQQIRPQWIAEIKVILESLKKISEANAALDSMRRALEEENIRTDSLPYSKYDIGGSWNDPFGGRVVGFQREASTNFSELADAAAQRSKSNCKS
jgi:hypothetical protein